MSERPHLHALADAAGILPAYVDIGGVRHETTDTARVALLAALGHDASTEAKAREARAAEQAAEARRLLPPVRVVRDTDASATRVTLCLPPRTRGVVVEIRAPDGRRQAVETGPSRRGGRRRVTVPIRLALGSHRALVDVEGPEGLDRQEQTLVVVPERAWTVREALGGERAWGVWANLYALRGGSRSFGHGSFGELAALAEWTGGRGGAFVGLNPLHSLVSDGSQPSPYGPVSRLYRHPAYLDLAAIPELEESEEARRWLEVRALGPEAARLEALDRVDYRGAAALQRPLLEALHRTFALRHRDGDTPRGRAYREWRRGEAPEIDDFATYQALREHFTEAGRPGGFTAWPEPYRDPRSPAVQAFRDAHPEAIDFHAWLQFEVDRQLAEVARRGRQAGLRLGLYTDLALSSAADGADAWMHPDLYVRGASLGAPPDPYAVEGQNWGLPPLHPARLHAQAYEPFRRLVETAFEHAGAVRIDHVMGLYRQFWIPDGESASNGAYVRFPGDDLLGILALESRRRRTLVIGEDLGTVPPELPSRLARRGVLSTRVLYFEQDREGRYRPARAYSRRALVTATTHDHVPLAGFAPARDLELRRALGTIPDDSDYEARRAERRRAIEALVSRLRIEGALAPGTGLPDAEAFVVAAYAFLARTPAPLLAVSLDDLGGETDPVNLPGISDERHPTWARRMREPLAAVLEGPLARQILEAVREGRARAGG